MNLDEKNRIMAECKEFLKRVSVFELRELGRQLGVKAPATKKKGLIIDDIISIKLGYLKPDRENNHRGAPIKTMINVDAIRVRLDNIFKDVAPAEEQYVAADVSNGFSVSDSAASTVRSGYFEKEYCGILDVLPAGYGFVRLTESADSLKDVYVSQSTIKHCRLAQGDYIVCMAKYIRESNSPALTRVLSINGERLDESRKIAAFEELVPCYPNRKFSLSTGNEKLSLRCLDLFCPIGRGQRGLIVAPPKAGKTTLLKDIAHSIEENYEEVLLMVALIDERPEEVTDIASSLTRAEVYSSTFDEIAESHIKVANKVIMRAKRMAERGKDVVILIDSLTKLTRAYNLTVTQSGRTLSGGLDAAALVEPKKFFGTARNTKDGGSVTILATVLVDTGSRMEEVIYEEFKGTGNMEIQLSRELAERRIFPAIDFFRSGTRMDELLLSDAEISCVRKIRKVIPRDRATEALFDMMRKTQNNQDFIYKVDDWVKLMNK